jgi:hypothetical protein
MTSAGTRCRADWARTYHFRVGDATNLNPWPGKPAALRFAQGAVAAWDTRAPTMGHAGR